MSFDNPPSLFADKNKLKCSHDSVFVYSVYLSTFDPVARVVVASKIYTTCTKYSHIQFSVQHELEHGKVLSEQ